MDPDGQHETPTQPTQAVLDPRRVGEQNSGFSDADIADIICLLLPFSNGAREQLSEMALLGALHVAEAEEAGDPKLQPVEGMSHMTPKLVNERAIILRLSAREKCKNPRKGFTFGRSSHSCDIYFGHDPGRRLSNTHFRIFFNEHGSLMIEDSSRNGTIIDDNIILRARPSPGETPREKLRTLTPGCTIKLLMADSEDDICFVVQVPRREGYCEQSFRKNLTSYMEATGTLRPPVVREDLGKTIIPGPSGHLDLFPANSTDLPSRDWTRTGKYNRVQKIGQGAFATVYQVTAKFDGRPYAAKEIDKMKFVKNGVIDQKVDNEMKIMQRAKHPNIVEYTEHFDWDDRLMIIIMEFVPEKDLGHLISTNSPLMEPIVQQTASQLLSALSYLHANNITHRDIKPENILVSSYSPFVVKLTDFGLSKIVDTEQTFLKTFCGTLLYCAPEVYNEFNEYDDDGQRQPRNRLRRRPASQRYDHAVDIWSLGGALHYTLTGQPPFPATNGISHTELLHQIMTRPLDTTVLEGFNTSTDGIDFLLGMLQRRPEQRATIDELRAHPWMKGMGFSQESEGSGGSQEDQAIDDLLGKGASQLSLDDTTWARRGPDADGNEIDMSKEVGGDTQLHNRNDVEATESAHVGSEKENYTFRHLSAQPRKLYGEVSAVDSLEGVTSTMINLPASSQNPKVTQVFDPQIEDSFDSVDSTPRQDRKSQSTPRAAAAPVALTQSSQRSVRESSAELESVTLDAGLQDLEGAESQLENLNMKSLVPSRGNLSSFSSSKRKTALDASDELDTTPRMRPPVKRLRSDKSFDASSWDEAEQVLYSEVPPLARSTSNRQIDNAVHKMVYWDAGDRKSWHLRYPEMTQLQHDAFVAAAQKRAEVFAPGRSPLWDLAMKHFAPRWSSSESGATTQSSGTSSVSDMSSKASVRRYSMFGGATRDADMPDTFSPEYNSLAPIRAEPPLNRVVATLESAAGSVLPGISISVNASMASWGRAVDNTHIYTPKTELKVPKHAFKTLLWKEGYEPSKNFRPWNLPGDAFFFYISTKANYGIQVNSTSLASFEPKNVRGPSQNWIRLHDGDTIGFWKSGDNEARSKGKLTFRCNWGGSSRPRDHMAELVPAQAAERLDVACRKAEERIGKLLEHDLRLQEADYDVAARENNMEEERRRSHEFEIRRLEACRVLAMRTSRRKSPKVPLLMAPPSSAPANMMAFGNYLSTRHESAPALQHAASRVDTRALHTMVEE